MPSTGTTVTQTVYVNARLFPNGLRVIARGLVGFSNHTFSSGSKTKVVEGTCFGQKVAVKLFNPNSNWVQPFKSEVDVYTRMSAFQGLHIPVLLLHGALDECHYPSIVTELAGKPLKSLPAPSERVKRRIRRSVKAFHRLGYIHGDIHSANILVTDSGFSRLVDFCETHAGGETEQIRELELLEQVLL